MSSHDASFLAELEDIIRQRLADDAAESYSARLVAAGVSRLAQKVGEEGVELAIAAATEDREAVVNESADLFYHVLVMLAQLDLKLDDVIAELRRRAD